MNCKKIAIVVPFDEQENPEQTENLLFRLLFLVNS
jgi:hypothetical protein